MRHVTVARLALALVALLAAAALLFAWHQVGGATPRGRSDEPADVLFDRNCGACHELDELAADLREAPDPARVILETLSLLADHGATDGPQDLSIAWLLLQRARASR